MKSAVLLWLVCLGVSLAAPVEEGGPQAASCVDPVVLGAARQAMDKINKDRTEGYVFSLRNLANAHTQKHGENSIMFYLTMNVLETNCTVVSRAHNKDCTVRDMTDTPVYGQCKVAIFISRVNRVSRLYKYDCVVRPANPEKVQSVCPDCSSLIDKDNSDIKKTVTKSLEKFNKESGLSKYFTLLQVTRTSAALNMGPRGGMRYFVEYTIQETTCANGPEKPQDCPLMDCEFAHKGFCKASFVQGLTPDGEEDGAGELSGECEIYEPEAAEKEKKLHLLGGETDHSHNDTHVTNPEQGHDHVHDHTRSHHDHTHPHQSDHHHHDHVHDHHSHGHAHSHDHGHGHDHVHAHHERAHDHTKDHPHQHHNYEHAAGSSTHHHDHELALDHDHKHAHLHPHEHHHHHHAHAHDHTDPEHRPEGVWRQTPALGVAVTLPAFPDVPAGPEAGVTLPSKPDPQIPGQMEPTVVPFPTEVSAQCPLPAVIEDNDFVAKLFVDDPEFTVGS